MNYELRKQFDVIVTRCNKCGAVAHKETDKELKKEYPYYCPECDENLYSFEVSEWVR